MSELRGWLTEDPLCHNRIRLGQALFDELCAYQEPHRAVAEHRPNDIAIALVRAIERIEDRDADCHDIERKLSPRQNFSKQMRRAGNVRTDTAK